MPAPKGNTYARNVLKFKTPEERRKVFSELVKHVESGYGTTSFPPLSWDAIQDYFENYPEEFDRERLEEAQRASLLLHEKVGWGGTTGKIRRFNAYTYKFLMINKFGWRGDAPDSSSAQPQKLIIEFPDETETDEASA